MLSKITKICDVYGIPYKREYNLGKNSYSRTGTKLRIAIFPLSREQLLNLHRSFIYGDIDYKVLGNTTNVLFLDSQIYKCFVFTTMLTDYELYKNSVIVDCGRSVTEFVRDLSMRSITGFEGLEGIPGTIGGALNMNAGAYGYCITDNLIDVDFIDSDTNVRRIAKSDLTILNRSIPQLKDKIILSAKFNLVEGVHSRIEKLTRKFHISRHQYQEWVYPNLGSIYIVPSLNINQDLRKIHTKQNIAIMVLYWLLFKIWFTRPLFVIRRLFPSFNFPFRLLKFLKIKSYNSEVASKTTVNTFANKNYSTLELLEYFVQLHKDSNGMIKLENEIYIENIDTVLDPDMRARQLKLASKLSRSKL